MRRDKREDQGGEQKVGEKSENTRKKVKREVREAQWKGKMKKQVRDKV